MDKARVAIVGGGITGLVAAWELERIADAEIDLYEASDRLGGKIGTSRVDGFLIEEGPDCFFTRKPGVMELIRELGLEGELIQPLQSEFAMLVRDRLHRVPRGLTVLTGPSLEALHEASFLSTSGKERASESQPFRGDDATVREFFTARFGEEFSRLVAEPLLAGTHGGDPSRLSMRALYPAYLDGATPTAGGSGPVFLSFRNGMGSLVDALAGWLERTRVHLGTSVDFEALPSADRYLFAIPSPVAGLAEIPHRSTAIVTVAFRREDIGGDLGYTGFLVPRGEHPILTGATWSSEKWFGRAPDDCVLMRLFLSLPSDRSGTGILPVDPELCSSASVAKGQHPNSPPPRGESVSEANRRGGINSSAAHPHPALPLQVGGGHLGRGATPLQVGGGHLGILPVEEEELTRPAVEAIRTLLEIEGDPIFTRLTIHRDAQPQYEVGHLEVVEEIEAKLEETPYHVAGTSYRGVGIPDCIRQGREAARQIASKL